MHNDISPGSILSDGMDCVFTDWCESYVGNPFITFEQACMHFSRKTNYPEMWVRNLRQIYRSCWEDVLTPSQIDKAFQLVPSVSVLSYLYARGGWLKSAIRHQSDFRGHARSLARHLDRIASEARLPEALCQ